MIYQSLFYYDGKPIILCLLVENISFPVFAFKSYSFLWRSTEAMLNLPSSRIFVEYAVIINTLSLMLNYLTSFIFENKHIGLLADRA